MLHITGHQLPVDDVVKSVRSPGSFDDILEVAGFLYIQKICTQLRPSYRATTNLKTSKRGKIRIKDNSGKTWYFQSNLQYLDQTGV